MDPKCWAGTVFVVVVILSVPSSVKLHEKCDADAKHGEGNQEVDIGEDSFSRLGQSHGILLPASDIS
jgi:hypothetical protein